MKYKSVAVIKRGAPDVLTATTDAAKSQCIAAGEALLALFDGIGWFLNTLLGGLSLLVSSLLMLRSNVYSKATAYVGILTSIAVCVFLLRVSASSCCSCPS